MESPVPTVEGGSLAPPPEPPARSSWRDWALVVACGLLLLVLSEALWLWQTWPVRELLQSAPTFSRPVVPR